MGDGPGALHRLGMVQYGSSLDPVEPIAPGGTHTR